MLEHFEQIEKEVVTKIYKLFLRNSTGTIQNLHKLQIAQKQRLEGFLETNKE